MFLILSGWGPAVADKATPSDWWVAINNDRAEEVEQMLADGVDPNAVGPAGQPAIMQAIRESAWDAYDVLVKHPKTAYNAINVNRETPLMYLAVIGDTERAVDMIRRGAQVNRKGWTALHYAASTGKEDTVAMLLEQGADVDARSPDGTTPLMMAAYANSEAVVRQLLAVGADLHLHTDQDYDVVDWAGFKQNTRLADKLQALIDQQRAGDTAGQEPGDVRLDTESKADQDETTTDNNQDGSTSRYFDLDRFDDPVTP